MKYLWIAMIVLLGTACTNDSGKSNSTTTTNDDGTTTVTTNAAEDENLTVVPNPDTGEQISQLNIPPDENGVVHHYVCADRCEGGFADAHGPCPVCGKSMGHNQGFHQNDPTPQPTIINAEGDASQISFDDLPDGIQDMTGQTQPTPGGPQVPEPAQNSKGVWHFICSNGCAGGAGSASLCTTCGSTLVHNTAYHN